MKRLIFIASVLLNVIFISLLVYKSGIFNTEIKHYANPYYQQGTTLFEHLPIDSTDIVFIGNSLTDRGEWHELLNNINVKNRGIGSDDTKGVLNRIENIAKGKPYKIFLMLGINDISLNVSPDTTIANYQKIIEKIKYISPQTDIYVQSILPINSDIYKGRGTNKQIELLNSKIKELQKVTYINLYPEFIDNGSLKKEYTDDGIHLLGDGYILWRNIIAKYVD